MIRPIVLRILVAIPLMLASTVVTFFAVSLAGDPLDRYRQPNVPQSTLDAKAAELGLDQPVAIRYWDWITGVLHGDLGLNSEGQPVMDELIGRSMISFRLIATAVLIAIVVAVVVGFTAAIHRNTWTDRALMAITILLLTAPEFWVAVVAKQTVIEIQGLTGTHLIATIGDSSPGIARSGPWEQFLDQLSHLILPTIVLVLAVYPIWAMYQRAAMVEVIDSDYIRLAIAKGLPRNRVLFTHGLRNALMPLVTVVTLRLPWIVSGLVVVETIFGWRGLGKMLVDGVQKQDTNTVLAFMLLVAVLITVLNLVADIIHRFLDPRLRDA
ncbi:MAG: ABC transporter permease [Microbacterium sp.]